MEGRRKTIIFSRDGKYCSHSDWNDQENRGEAGGYVYKAFCFVITVDRNDVMALSNYSAEYNKDKVKGIFAAWWLTRLWQLSW